MSVLLALLVLGTIGAGYYFSSELLDPEHPPLDFDVEVLEADGRTALLERNEDTERPGVYGLDLEGAHAIAGPVISETERGVRRRVDKVQGEFDRGREVYVNSTVANGDPLQSEGIPFRTVEVETELGPMPSWLIEGRADTWAILVHGYKASRRWGLRYAELLRDLGLPELNVTYRNDPGNPEDPSGLITLGKHEWLDVEAAMRWARRHGAERFVLIGDSMGGAIVANLYHRSRLAPLIDALILDAPVLDWGAVLDLQGEERDLPPFVIWAAKRWVAQRIGIDFAHFDQIARADEFTLPILLFHGTDDEVVPFETSREFADALPQRVTFYPARRAGHVEAWNVGPRAYEQRVRRFLERHVARSTR